MAIRYKQGIHMTSHNVYFATLYVRLKPITDTPLLGDYMPSYCKNPCARVYTLTL